MTVEELKDEKELFEKSLKDMLKHFLEKTGVSSVSLSGGIQEHYTRTADGNKILLKRDYKAELTIEI